MAVFDLADLAKPMTRADALKSRALIDTTAAARFLGFTVPSAVSLSVWDEVVGGMGVTATQAERGEAAERLRLVWFTAMAAVRAYKAQGVVLPRIRFPVQLRAGAQTRLVLLCTKDGHQPVLTIYLEGEV